ncbi:MAG: hAT transposon family protein, partial [Pseudomonadota bacterium]
MKAYSYSGVPICNFSFQDETAFDYYRRSVWYKLLDLLICEFKERFSTSAKVAMRMAKLLPAHCNESDSRATARDAIHEYQHFLESPAICLSEFERWQDLWKNQTSLGISLEEALRSCDRDLYPNIYKLLTIFLVTPVTTCTAERSFSHLRLLKTHHRSVMG